YEVVDSPWGTRLLIGDVRGKGLDAVRIASRVLSCFRLMSRHTGDLRDLLANLDAEVADVSGLDDFVTAVVGQVDGSRLTLANAGHPDPVLVRAGQADLLTVSSRLPPLGLITDGSNVTDAALRAGDRLLLYTDGITEARAPTTGAFFPLLPAVGAAFAHASLDEALTDLADRVRDWTRSTLNDDVALLAVEVPGPTRHAGPTDDRVITGNCRRPPWPAGPPAQSVRRSRHGRPPAG
ncbi:PP2C family protein-serine/threonine phosphatase, partial [Frankia sp. CcWB2]